MNTMGCASCIWGIFKLKSLWHLSQPFTNGNSEKSLIWSVMKIAYLFAVVLIHDFYHDQFQATAYFSSMWNKV